MITAQDYLGDIKQKPVISSGDTLLDQILQGGFISGITNLLIGSPSYLSGILMRTAVNALSSRVDGGGEFQQVAYIDGINTFNPYFISKYASSKNLNPNYILDRIIVSRTFTWNQMVEVIEEKIKSLKNVDLMLISGFTSLFEEILGEKLDLNSQDSINNKIFQDLLRMIAGIKVFIKENDPIVIMSCPFNSKSRFRPAGGHILTHFGGIIVGIREYEHYLEYILDQHPFLSYKVGRIWKSLNPKKKDPFNLTLDMFMRKNSYNEVK